MKKINITVDNYKFEFICDARNTRSGFAHDCNLFLNDREIQTAHAYYLNRTWESWSYQTVCMHAVNNVIEDYLLHEKYKYMAAAGYKRMTKSRRADFIEKTKNNNYYMALTGCREKLAHNLY